MLDDAYVRHYREEVGISTQSSLLIVMRTRWNGGDVPAKGAAGLC